MFLDSAHAWRRSKKIDGLSDHRSKPKELNGDNVLNQLNHVNDCHAGKHPDV
jgi:hypothetical protein